MAYYICEETDARKVTLNPILTGGGGGEGVASLRVYDEYFKNGLTDLHETL